MSHGLPRAVWAMLNPHNPQLPLAMRGCEMWLQGCRGARSSRWHLGALPPFYPLILAPLEE